MRKFDDKEQVNAYRKKRRESDPAFRESEKRAYQRYRKKRKEREDACPELREKRLAKQRAYMKEYYRKKKEKES